MNKDERKFRFTKAAVDRLPIPTEAQAGSAGFVVYRDAEVAGLWLLVRPTGVKTFVLRYTIMEGAKKVERRWTIGQYGRHTVESARLAAKRLNGVVAAGRDPVLERREDRACGTWTELFGAYEGYIEATSIEPDVTLRSVRRVKGLLSTSLGHKLVVQTDARAVEEALEDHEDKRGNYNLALTYIRAAVRWGRGKGKKLPKTYEDPTETLRLQPSIPKAHVVGVDEYRRILRAIDEMLAGATHDHARLLAIQFICFSGCRVIDAMRLRKDDISFDNRTATLTKHKTVRVSGPKTIHLSPQLVTVIERALALHTTRGIECEYIFPRTTDPKVSVWLAKTWEGVRLRAKTKLELRQLRTGFIVRVGGKLCH